MRILFITRDKFPPFRPAASAIFQVELVKRGHDIDWILQAARPQDSCVVPFGSGTAYVGAKSSGTRLVHRLIEGMQDLFNYLRVFRLLRVTKYDIVQVKDHYIQAVFALIACKLYGTPFFYWMAYPHAEGSLYKSREGITKHKWYYLVRGHTWGWMLYRVILPAADHVFVQSEQMKRDFAAEGIAVDRMTAVPGSVDLKAIPYDTSGKVSPTIANMGDYGVVYLGTLSRVRHLDFLLRVFVQVLKAQSSARLYVLGKGDEPEDDQFLKAEAERLGIEDKVVFTGHLPMELAWEYVRNSAVCVSPYYPTMILNSTSPTKLVEYLAMGKAAVGNDHPEQKLVLEQSGGGLCVNYDETAFANAVLKLLQEPEKAHEMGLRGRAYVEKYRTNSVMADIVEQHYLRTLAR